MNNFKIPVITGALAIAAVIITIIVVGTGSAGSGLYIMNASGDVSVSRSGVSETAAADMALEQGDIITVNPDSQCTVIYRSRDNKDQNYIILEPSTQVFVNGEFKGKDDQELYLNRGAMLVSSMEEASANVLVRTAHASVTTEEAAMHISCTVGDELSTTYAASFGGYSEIRLYDSFGNPVYRDNAAEDNAEILGEGRCGKINCKNGGKPEFEYLNIDTELKNYSSKILKELLTVSAFHELSFASSDIKAAYDEVAAAGDNMQPAETAASESETAAPETTVTEETTTPASTETETEPVTTTTPATTTERPVTTTAYTTTTAVQTAPPETEPAYTESNMLTVYIIIEDEIYTQEVPYGGDAEQPADPIIEGKKFVGWDGSFENITEDELTISAIFEDDENYVTTSATTVTDESEIFATSESDIYLTVTVSVNGTYTAQKVKYGESAILPAVNIPGYIFLGWDRSPDNITEDCTITALLVPDGSDPNATDANKKTYTVTFIVDGVPYPVTVAEGESAVAPVAPTINSKGQIFVGWDTDFSKVTSDLTVTAIFM